MISSALTILFTVVALGFLAGIFVYVMRRTVYILESFRIPRLSMLWDDIVEYYKAWKKDMAEKHYFEKRLPELKAKTRQGDNWSLAERLTHIPHSRRGLTREEEKTEELGFIKSLRTFFNID